MIWRNRDRVVALLTLLPTLLLIAFFVYGFIGHTFVTSLTESVGRGTLAENPERDFVGGKHYVELFSGILPTRFRQDLVNTFFYMVFVTLGALFLGLVFAILLDREPKGTNFFQTILLMPMAVSFVVTGTIWRWLLTDHGINAIPTLFGLARAEFGWVSSKGQILRFNWQDMPRITAIILVVILAIFAVRAWKKGLRRKSIFIGIPAFLLFIWAVLGASVLPFPRLLDFEEIHGFNLASLGIILAILWQYSGYPMAIYLAGLHGISSDVYEAARLDGCNLFQYYTRIAIPLLRPLTLSAMIILAHVSLKVFALIFALAGPDNARTSHLSLLMFLKSFRANAFGKGAAIAIVLFVLVSLLVVPYLVSSYRQQAGIGGEV
jgi:glucose/mannose transport system permease protein